MKREKTFNYEYAAVQGLYWMGFCVAVSYAAVYLKHRGYSNSELGLVLAAGNIAGFLLAPPLASTVDRSKRVTAFHILAALLGVQFLALGAMLLLPGRSFLVSLLYAVYLASVQAVNPLNTQLVHIIGNWGYTVNYGAARGTGSLCFVPMSYSLGIVAERFGIPLIPYAGLIMVLLQFLLLGLINAQRRSAGYSALSTTGGGQDKSSSLPVFFAKNKRFCVLLLGTALLFSSHSTITNFLINVVENVGGSTASMGELSAFMAAVEIPAMFLYERLSRKLRCVTLLRVAVVAFLAKSLATALSPSLPCLYAATALQAISFAIFIPATVQYVNLTIAPEDSAKGQSLSYSMITMGNVLSSLFGGMMYDHFTVSNTLLIASGVALVATFTCMLGIESKRALR